MYIFGPIYPQTHDGGLRHVVYQQVEVTDEELNDLYLRASYSKMEGLLENEVLPGLEDAAGLAGVYIEYIGENDDDVLGDTGYVNIEDPLFAGVPLSQTPETLQLVEHTHNSFYLCPRTISRASAA